MDDRVDNNGKANRVCNDCRKARITELDYNRKRYCRRGWLCSQRGLTISGTKAEIIARLVVDDESVEESEETEPITDGDENGGESESE